MIIDMVFCALAIASICLWFFHQRMIEKHISNLEKKIDNLSNEMDRFESRLFTIESKVYDCKAKVTMLETDLGNVIKTEQRKSMHKTYTELAARYKKLAKEYAK